MGLLRKIILSLICIFTICISAHAHAQGIVVKQAELEKTDTGWLLNANFSITLPTGLENALNKGVTLYFTYEFMLTRGRWYWFDERAVRVERQIRLSHQPLINQYRITVGDFTFSATSLPEALRVAGTIGGWSVIEAAAISPARIAVINPAPAPAPVVIPNASASGRATIPTVIPANKSLRQLVRALL